MVCSEGVSGGGRGRGRGEREGGGHMFEGREGGADLLLQPGQLGLSLSQLLLQLSRPLLRLATPTHMRVGGEEEGVWSHCSQSPLEIRQNLAGFHHLGCEAVFLGNPHRSPSNTPESAPGMGSGNGTHTRLERTLNSPSVLCPALPALRTHSTPPALGCTYPESRDYRVCHVISHVTRDPLTSMADDIFG